MVDRFTSFFDLADYKREGVDYTIFVKKVEGSNIAIVAPHGGVIEPYTSEIARAAAADDYNLYLFEAIGDNSSFEEMHVTSNSFDEPRCLELISTVDRVVTIHGCRGVEPVVYLGGLCEYSKVALQQFFTTAGIPASLDGHIYTGASPGNICNKGRLGAGVQIELSRALRDNIELRNKSVTVIRQYLRDIQKKELKHVED